MKKPIFIVIAILLSIIVIKFLTAVIPASGVFHELESTLVESCRSINIFSGTEDVAINSRTGLVFISASERRSTSNDDGIFAFDLNQTTDPKVWKVSSDELANFHPHGISLWHGEEGQTRLFVINHRTTGENVVEIFDVAVDGILKHLESISFDAMDSPNDLVAVGARQFYASNDHGYLSGIMMMLEQYFALPFASAVYFDGNEGRIIKSGLVAANGINQSADGKTIYISEALKQRISVFDRNIETGELTKVKHIDINTVPDNIDVDENGYLWIAGHSKIFEFVAHAADRTENAPSHVIKVDPVTGELEDMFISLNGEINAASVGAMHNNTLVVGAVFDGHVMVCPL